MKTKKILFILALLCAMVQGAWATISLNKSGGNYIIGSETDWNTFCSDVYNGETYDGKTVLLTANISVTTKCGKVIGSERYKAFWGTFNGGGYTITANIEESGNQATALFCYIYYATIKNLKVAGTITSNMQHAAALVGFARGTCRIENCVVSATVNGGTHVGGLVGHALNSDFTVSGSVFSGLMTGGDTAKGALIGWGDSGNRTLTNCFYVMANGQNTDGLDLVKGSGIVNVSNSYKTTNAGTYGTRAYTAAPADNITKPLTAADGNSYYVACIVSGVKGQYLYTGSPITVTPTVTFNGTPLTNGTDYTSATSPATVQEKGDYTLTVTGQGDCTGTKAIPFTVTDGTPVTSETTTMTDWIFAVNEDVTISSRITISGDVILILGNGATLTASKGIELSSGNNANLTIDGTGTLTINDCDQDKSGIGAASVGTLVINGGTINVTGGQYGAGIGGDIHNSNGGNIYINGGIINVTGGQYGAGIGGGYDDQYEQHTFCGNIYINGGQVTATAGEKACGIGPGYSKDLIDMGNGYAYSDKGYSSGSLTLSWTSVDNDFVNINRLNEDNGGKISSITIADGKQFVIGETTIDSNTTDLINMLNGKFIWPYGQGGDFVLTDGNTYIRTGSIPVNSATYTKTTDRVGKFHSWLVPFDHTITSTDLQNFTFYKINMIANAPNPQTNASDEMWVFLKQLGEGDMLHANMPYVYKPLKAVTDYTFTTNNAVLKAKNTGVIADASTLEDIYSFYATYDATTATAQDPFYYVNIDGGISLGNDGTVSVGAFRWIIRVESKFGGSTAYARKMTFFDGESDVTGITTTNFTNYTNSDAWYTLDGRKLDGKPAAKGIYMNGGKKVVIK